MAAAKKTYHKAQKYDNLLNILKLMSVKPQGVTGDEIVEELELNKTTCLSALESLLKYNFAEKQGDRFFLGNEAGMLWANRLAILKARKEKTDKELESLNV